jgi:hypothetical protein
MRSEYTTEKYKAWKHNADSLDNWKLPTEQSESGASLL